MTQEKTNKKGRLIMAATHIGNLEDVPLRTINALKMSDLLIFEEDKPARSLLKKAGIQRAYLKYNEHRSEETLESLRSSLKKGETVCYVSDQGSPTLADPGRKLLEITYALKCEIQVIPGPSAVTAAISACPFNMDRFVFQGFLPAETEKREKQLLLIRESKVPSIILDTPYRLDKLLQSCLKIFPESQKAFLALDITGEEELYSVGSFKKLSQVSEGKKLNFVLIINGSTS